MSHEEEAFLSAIEADPADDTTRLVYADWLEEHGDGLRAEYIRLRLAVRAGERGRKRMVARVAGRAGDIDDDWRRRVLSVPKLKIEQFRRVEQPVTEPVTKFGGQPVWLGEPAWPISRSDGVPMQFVCQVSVPAFFGPAL